jgi:RecA/RadA recombinase
MPVAGNGMMDFEHPNQETPEGSRRRVWNIATQLIQQQNNSHTSSTTMNDAALMELLQMPEGNTAGNTAVFEGVMDSIRSRAAVALTASDMLRHMEECRCLPLGCREIDDMLDGGVLEGHVLEVYGESGSGKTQLCHMAASMTASRGEGVLYIDTSGCCWSGRRMEGILKGVNGEVDVGEVLERVAVVQGVYDVESIVRHIHEYFLKVLSDGIRNRNTGLAVDNTVTHARCTMIVVDCLGSVVAPMLGGASYDVGHEMMVRLAMYLKQVAVEFKVAVIVTNYTVGGSFSSSSVRRAMGDMWPGQVHTSLQLGRLETDDDIPQSKSQEGSHWACVRQSTTIQGHRRVTFSL